MQVEQKLQECLDTLVEIKESGYWPYASPAPSSSEVKIKEGIDKSINALENALYWHRQVFSKHNRDCMRAPEIVITRIL